MNDYIIFYDEVLGRGQFGIVVKAQLASDLHEAQYFKKSRTTIRSQVDYSKQVFACKIYDTSKFSKKDMQIALKEVKINNMVRSDFCVRQH